MSQKPPRPWELQGELIRIADRVERLADVAGCRLSCTYEPNVIGHLGALGLFLSMGCAFVLPVAMALARPKFLLGGALFIGLGLTLIVEIWRMRGIELYCVDVALRSGDEIRFTSAERAEAEALAAVLRQGGRSSS